MNFTTMTINYPLLNTYSIKTANIVLYCNTQYIVNCNTVYSVTFAQLKFHKIECLCLKFYQFMSLLIVVAIAIRCDSSNS